MFYPKALGTGLEIPTTLKNYHLTIGGCLAWGLSQHRPITHGITVMLDPIFQLALVLPPLIAMANANSHQEKSALQKTGSNSFSITQFLMVITLIAILIALSQAQGCGTYKSKISDVEFSKDGQFLAVVRRDGRSFPGIHDQHRTVSIVDLRSKKSNVISSKPESSSLFWYFFSGSELGFSVDSFLVLVEQRVKKVLLPSLEVTDLGIDAVQIATADRSSLLLTRNLGGDLACYALSDASQKWQLSDSGWKQMALSDNQEFCLWYEDYEYSMVNLSDGRTASTPNVPKAVHYGFGVAAFVNQDRSIAIAGGIRFG